LNRSGLCYFAFTSYLLAVAGCSSVASLNLQSNPVGAEVWVAPLDGSNPKKLGQTPLLIPSDEAQKVAGTTGAVVLEFRKDGYIPARSMVTDLVPADISITSQMQRSTGLENIETLNGVVDRLFEAQRLVRAGRLDDALKMADQVEKDAPELSAVYEIQGGIYYLQKKPKQSLDAYQSSIRFNPKNSEAIRMRNYLMAQLGIAAPAQSPSAPVTGGKP
jgi:tetratricopeptide (TPR) repeat protein